MDGATAIRVALSVLVLGWLLVFAVLLATVFVRLVPSTLTSLFLMRLVLRGLPKLC